MTVFCAIGKRKWSYLKILVYFGPNIFFCDEKFLFL